MSFHRDFLASLVCILPVLGLPVRAIPIPNVSLAELYLGSAIVGMLFLSAIFVLIENRVGALTISIGAGASAFLLLVLLSAVLGVINRIPAREAAVPVMKIGGAIMLCLFAIETRWNSVEFRWFFAITSLGIYVASAIAWGSAGFPEAFVGYTSHKNNLGVAAMATVLIAAVFSNQSQGWERMLHILVAAIALISVIASSSRSCQGTLGITAAIFSLLSPVRRYGRSNVSAFVGVFAVIFLASCIVPSAYLMSIREMGDEAQIGGRNIYNGRDWIWPMVMENIRAMPLLGHGKEFWYRPPAGDWNTEMHCHNLMLATVYHCGVLGWVTFGLFLCCITRLYAINLEAVESRIGLGFLVGIVACHEVFEQAMLYSHITYPALWLVIGLTLTSGAARVRDLSLKQNLRILVSQNP